MINYIGDFSEIEKEYIDKHCNENNAILMKVNSYCPYASTEDIIDYINIKLQNTTSKVLFFDKKSQNKIHSVVTPSMFISNCLNNVENANLLLMQDCVVYIQQGCSENCICTSACKYKFSVPIEDIKKQILDLPQKDIISLYGINVGDYDYNGADIVDLCKQLLEEFKNSKIMLCNISPFSPMLPKLVEYVKQENRIIPVLFMCVNSGSKKILDIEGHKNIENDLIFLLNNSNIKICPYLIVGSPEEEIEDFNFTIKWVEKHKDILIGAIILPYTVNGVGNCNQTIASDELIRRVLVLKDTVMDNSVSEIKSSISLELLKNILQISVSGEDHKFYKRYGFDCL